ncbi:P-loop NTPase fold protein [Maledivibacter halophilus]|uniref:KAP family P-loop domain-containing protein n=1 Tax=Maledivibacter halophilus TaxID=36842 RepID=A0A1T5MQL5_9FIRM|nr:P-loop NTPase fold protein [Maledivibacter halophilus]SKC90516.1 KAP family P-loop domain-containing protein [Maledivibacter halophilus]
MKVVYSNEKSTWIMGMLFYLFILGMLICSFLLDTNKKNNIENKKLIVKRKKDLKRLLDYLDLFKIIGIDGEWGSGKSFLVNELKKKIKDKYEIIEIDVLSCDLNELQLVLTKEIEKIIHKHRIISKYSNKLKKFLGEDKFIQKLSNLIFPETYTYSEIVKGFKDELNKIDKKILIIYEDIDRISDKKIIKNIFAISEKISSDNIKIIYQFHEYKLNEIGFDSSYLEKYIPYRMHLTQMNFFEIVKFVLEENNIDKSILEIKDFDFMKDYKQRNRYTVLRDKFQMNQELFLDFYNFSIRKVEHYIFELFVILKDEEYRKHKDTVLSFFLVKHFLPEVYKEINIEKGLVETLKFNHDSNSYTLIELIAMKKSGKLNKEKINNIFNIKKNKKNYCVLKLFNYNHDELINEKDVKNPLNVLRNRINNEKKDRIIWSLLENGKSKYTDYEYVGKKFIHDVLKKPRNYRVNAYNNFHDDLFNQDSQEIDNTTIFKLFTSPFLELFKAFRFLDVTDEEKIALIDIYFKIDEIKYISSELIQNINYCSLTTKKEYIYILKRINKLNVSCNLNVERSFTYFLKKCIIALYNFGYIKYGEHSAICEVEVISDYRELVIEDIKEIIKDIKNLKNKIIMHFEFKELEDEFNTIIIFFEKMIELLDCKIHEKNKTKGPSINYSISNKTNQYEFERLKALKKNSNFNQEVKKSYSEGKITPYEIYKLIEILT